MATRLLALIFTLLAVLGLGALLSYIALVVAVHVTNIEGPQGDAGWAWIAAGVYGAPIGLLSAALAIAFWQRSRRA